jgi:hypothetical protein
MDWAGCVWEGVVTGGQGAGQWAQWDRRGLAIEADRCATGDSWRGGVGNDRNRSLT